MKGRRGGGRVGGRCGGLQIVVLLAISAGMDRFGALSSSAVDSSLRRMVLIVVDNFAPLALLYECVNHGDCCSSATRNG